MGQDYDAVVAKSQQLILRGQAADAVDFLHTMPEPARDQTVHLLLGDAYRMKRDFTSALAAYREVDDPGCDTPIEAAVAWRLGQIHQQQDEPRRALEVYGRAAMTEADAVDHAWLLAGVATAHWLLGDADQALAYARAAGARATIASDPRVQAAAHIAMALAVSLGGDPATVEEEYARAAACATRLETRSNWPASMPTEATTCSPTPDSPGRSTSPRPQAPPPKRSVRPSCWP